MNKKFLSLMCIGVMSASLVGCGSDDSATSTPPANNEVSANETPQPTPEPEVAPTENTKTSVVVSVSDANGDMIDLEVPYMPQRIVVMDYVAMDMIDSWGLSSNIVGMAKNSSPEYLNHLVNDDSIVNLGGLKDVDLEAMMELEPDIIFTSGRLRSEYDTLSQIAPVVMTSMDYEDGVINSFEKYARRNATIFGMEDMVEVQIDSYSDRIAALKEVAEGKTAIVGIATGGSLSTLGDGSRCSIIGNDLGFINVANDVDTEHGNASSYELFLSLDPDYMFILDRDAVTTDGATPAMQLMDNEIIHETQAYQNDMHIYRLQNGI